MDTADTAMGQVNWVPDRAEIGWTRCHYACFARLASFSDQCSATTERSRLLVTRAESRKARRRISIGGRKKAALVQAGGGRVSSFCQADFCICEANSIIFPRFSRGTHFTLFRKLLGI